MKYIIPLLIAIALYAAMMPAMVVGAVWDGRQEKKKHG